jgi:membrane-bound lytic murein transglycosylase A
MSRIAFVALAGLIAVLLAGCQKPEDKMGPFNPEAKDYGKPLPPGALALRKIDPKDYPDFGRGFANREGLEQAIRNSLIYLAKPSSQKYFPYGDISHDRAVKSLERFLEVLRTASSSDALNQAVRNEFDVYQSVGCDDRGTVFFTGYYTPIFEGRREREGQYRYPLYSLPSDLVKDEEGQCLGRRRPDGGTDPGYATRREIEQGRLLDGLEVAYLKTPFEAYVVTVQGSAKLRLADGSIYEVGYAGNNGHNYSPVALAMVHAGVIRRDEISLQTLLKYFGAHPEQTYHYCWQNDRYVFFKEASGGPFGSLNVPVTRFRSVATDKQVFPRACLAYLTSNLPVTSGGQVVQKAYATFACDQDTGGAIRAAGRSDIYMGVGPEAEAVAGRTGSEGALYYVFVRDRARK